MTALTETIAYLSPHARMILRQMRRDRTPFVIHWPETPPTYLWEVTDAHAIQELLAAGLIHKVQAFVLEPES